jgi:hypothetical protein
MRGDSTVTPPRTDHEIAALAARQHGLVTRAQLLGAGIAVHAVDRRVKVERREPARCAPGPATPVIGPHASGPLTY